MRPSDPTTDETQTHRTGAGDAARAPTVTVGDGPLAQSTDFTTSGPSLFKIGNFEILEVIAQGGMGVVYKARELPLGRIVALKQLDSEGARHPSYRERFMIEAKAVAALDHPNIVPIYHYGVDNDVPYFTMKYMANGALAKYRGRYKGDARSAVTLMVKVARAVHHAHMHEYKILHRDLKPHNIFLDENNEPVVGDFGLAKLLEGNDEITRTRIVLGTPGYMAPEQNLGRHRDLCFATDVYALGVTLYELIVGRKPFDADDVVSTVTSPGGGRSIEPEPAPLDPALDAIIQKCLRDSPAERYATAGALADDLEGWLDGKTQVIDRSPDAPLKRKREPLSKTRRAFLIGAGGLIIGLAGWQGYAAYRRRNTADADELADELRRTGAVNLLRTDGWPRRRELFGDAVELSTSSENGQALLQARCKGWCLIELSPNPGIEEFELTAWVRQDALQVKAHGVVGLYCGRSLQGSPPDSFQCFIADHFHEGAIKEEADIDAAADFQLEVIFAGPRWRNSPFGSGRPPSARGAWRMLQLTMSRDRILASNLDCNLQGRTRGELFEHIGKAAVGASAAVSRLTPTFKPSEGVGLLVKACSASFRDVTLKRLS